ncbi:MAG TPA: adenylate/guanylate cyclase domain-containing protein, partial [Gaiellaceae bacterium]
MPVCSHCGQENPEIARFCLACGQALGPATAPPVQERKLVTVLFADVIGSTGLGEQLDAEELEQVMSAWFRAMRSEIEAREGTVEKFIGDAVMAVFGVPQAHEDDVDRALEAALAMRERLRGLNAELGRAHGIALEMRIGVNTGEVMAVGEPHPGEAMATGDAVNAASRLEQLAEPGQILVAERTARAARGFFLDEVGGLELRGRNEPLRAFALVSAAPLDERGAAGLRAPIVGRGRELALLDALYERVVAEGRPHLTTIYADPGIGKSRLLTELGDRA